MSLKKVVVFGTSSLSSLAWYSLTHDSAYTVVAFTVDQKYLSGDQHEGLPVIAFESIQSLYPPGSISLCIPLGSHAINGLRKDKYEKAKELGYELVSYVSRRVNPWPGFEAGINTLIYEGAILQPFASVGNNTIIRSGAHISHHCHISDHVFIAAGVVLGGGVSVGEQAFIGLGAIVRDGVKIAPRSFIGAGSVVTRDTESDCVYVGNPARRIEKTALEVTNG